MPFTLRQMALLAAGAFKELVPKTFSRTQAVPETGRRYLFAETNRSRSLTLDWNARPIQVQGVFQGRPWRLRIHGCNQGQAGEFPGPEKLTLELQPDSHAVLRIKKMERKPEPWPEKALLLKLPPGTKIKDYK